MTHMMDDPVVAMMFLLGLVVVLAVGFLAVRLYGAHQRTPHVPAPAPAPTPASVQTEAVPEATGLPSLEQ